MKNINFAIIVILSTGLCFSCEKEDLFEFQPASPKVSEVDSIEFSPGHKVLVADGNAQLEMVIDIYRKYTYTTSTGETRDTSVFAHYSSFPDGALKIIHVETGNILDGLTYSTTDASPGVASFYAQIGEVKSATKTVVLEPAPPLPPKRVVNLIFHIFELSTNDAEYNKYSAISITPDLIDIALKDLNAVFNNELSKSAASASANIEFKLATHDTAGAVLTTPGISKTIFTVDQINEYNPYIEFGYTSGIIPYIKVFIDQYTWDPDNYVNVLVIPTSPNSSLSDQYPQAHIYDPDVIPLEGMGTLILPNKPLPSVFEENPYGAYCLPVAGNVFFPGENKRITLAPYFGRFWGLFSTRTNTPTDTDYCNDTRKYDWYAPVMGEDGLESDFSQSQFNTLIRVGWDLYKFKCDNLMDDIRYPSLRNTLTPDQVERVRYALDHCPGRRPGWNN